MVDILGLSGMVWVTLVYADTQGVGHGGHPRIFWDSPVSRCMRILIHRGLVMVDILRLTRIVWVSLDAHSYC